MSENSDFSLIREALDLVNTGVKFDKAGLYVGAIDYYDMAILNMNEVLNKIPIQSDGWNKLMELRSRYDERLEQLRDHESAKYDIGAIMSSAVSSTSQSGQSKSSQRRPSLSKIKFEEDMQLITDCQHLSSIPSVFEAPPTAMARVPYWQLRMLLQSIRAGGYLTPSLFMPRMAWTQPGAKFSGLSVKLTAFEQYLGLLNQYVSNLALVSDLANLHLSTELFQNFYDELISLQNNLAKPFPFIREMRITQTEISSPTKSQVAHFASMMSAFAKKARKMAEVGYNRIGTISSTASVDEMSSFNLVVSSLCEKSQTLDKWYTFLVSERDMLIRNNSAIEVPNNGDEMSGNTDFVKSSACDQETLRGTANQFYSAQSDEINLRIQLLEGLLGLLVNVSFFMREVICELILRDAEQLLERYMRKMRKSFARMLWDDDGEIDATEFFSDKAFKMSPN